MSAAREARLLLAVLVAQALGAGQAAAQCYAAEATATIDGGTNGFVFAHHFGHITMKKPLCPTDDQILRARTLLDSQIAISKWVEGAPAVLGAHVSYDAPPIETCSGTWRSTTEYGTGSSAFANFLATDISNLLVASCPPQRDRGPGPCAAGFEDTTTWTFADGGSKLADHQFGLGLSRFEERPEGFYLFEEWAMLGVGEEGMHMRLGSAASFQDRLEETAEAFRPLGRRERRVLVVQAGNHPHNERHVPQPKLVPMEVNLSGPEEAFGPVKGEFWFRAEVAPTGEVDRMLVLESSVPIPQRHLHEAIRENLILQHETDKRHRVVVFGLARGAEGGLMSVNHAMVVTPQCCCSSDPEAPPCL
jgi:hypothetical protein